MFAVNPRFASLALCCALACGCSTQAFLTISSQPEGAFITERDTGNSYGTAPVTVFYDSATLQKSVGPDGCYLVKGFEARWVSGVVAALDNIRLCGSATGRYTISYNRDPQQAGLDRDLQFALQLQAVRAQQQQAAASEAAAAAALFSAWSISQPIRCMSTQIGNTVQTSCR
ncbi:MAG: hypothetical protein WDZ63_13280 [Burkholderiales bacterium]